MSIFEKIVSQQTSQRVGAHFGDGWGGIVGNAAGIIAQGTVKSALPIGVGPVFDAAVNSLGQVLQGNFGEAALSAVNSGIFTSRMPWLDNAESYAAFMSQPSRAMGGVTPVQARQIMQASLETHFAHKNLFVVSLSVDSANQHAMENLSMMNSVGGMFDRINLFVVDIGYGPITISADSHKVGAAVLDAPNGSEPTDLRITTMDDEKGSVRRWFDNLAGKLASPDGTFGLPREYLVKIKVTHSFVTDQSSKNWIGGVQPWSKEAWYRPMSLEVDLSRKDEALEEFTMVFHQFDTYFS